MEVGAVKQAFNNEVIHLKKKLNQAKIQIIHKLTRKAKTLTQKNPPEHIKEKLNRKAKAAISEVLVIKKITNKDLAKFAITHAGILKDYLNKPNVDQDKACARLLLHKCLQDKYQLLRRRFSNVPIEDLLMSREERRKLKKEQRENQKNKKKGVQNGHKAVNSQGDWSVEDVNVDVSHKDIRKPNEVNKFEIDSDETDSEHDQPSDSEDDVRQNISDSDADISKIEQSEDSYDDEVKDEHDFDIEGSDKDIEMKLNETDFNNDGDTKIESLEGSGRFVKLSHNNTTAEQNAVEKCKKDDNRKKPKKNKDSIRNKNLVDKIQFKKFKKVMVKEEPIKEHKVIDPFFITSTGENYMSLAEPRAPDEVKEVHKQGNRQMRRAAMFGHIPKFRPRQQTNFEDNDRVYENKRFNKQDRFHNNKPSFRNNNNNQENDFKNNRHSFKSNQGRGFKNNEHLNQSLDTKTHKNAETEKLHPSWEAKKRMSGILPFKGKKVVFDED